MSAPDELWIWTDTHGDLRTWIGDQPNPQARLYVRASSAPQAGVRMAKPMVLFIAGRDGDEPEVIQPDEDADALVAEFDKFYPAHAPHMILHAYPAAPSADAGVREALVLALERARGCIKGLLARTPVRDVAETLAEIDAALSPAAQQPTETKHGN